MKIIAYAWQTGLIEFGRECPKGALPVAVGDEHMVRQAVGVMARHTYDNKTLLVPGIPEAENNSQALDALMEFRQRVKDYVERASWLGPALLVAGNPDQEEAA